VLIDFVGLVVNWSHVSPRSTVFISIGEFVDLSQQLIVDEQSIGEILDSGIDIIKKQFNILPDRGGEHILEFA